MKISALSAADKRTLYLGAIVAVAGILSFMDPSGSWGAVVVLGILGGLLAVYVAVQPQMAPTMKLPATKGMLLLVAGGAAALGFVIAGLTWFSYVIAVTRVFSIIFDVGLVAALALAWFGWLAYQLEPKTAAAAAPASASEPAPPPAPPAA
jgi:hypothetical protein